MSESLLENISADEAERFAEWQSKVAGLNVHKKTLLATDYVNHFNEIVMLIEMISDMPDMISDCREWKPKSYTQHFQDSDFSDKDVIIQAYAHIPTGYRQLFERTVARIDGIVATGLNEIQKAINSGDDSQIRRKCDAVHSALENLITALNSLIYGSGNIDQASIDSIILE